jgi:LmbE family N-acetylglucosaminyl deacetylase
VIEEANAMAVTDHLPGWRRPLAVVAHPDDESFGLGAVLSMFEANGAWPFVLCFTHGEASTLHGVQGDLRTLRATELEEAAHRLGIAAVDLRDEPDGGLADRDQETLAAAVGDAVARWACDGLVTFDLGGVTGHPDHDAATRAAIRAGERLGLGVLGWCLPEKVAAALNMETGAPFLGRPEPEIDVVVDVDRGRQLDAVEAHPSQAVPGSVLWRRLELLGSKEHLHWLLPSPVANVDRPLRSGGSTAR